MTESAELIYGLHTVKALLQRMPRRVLSLIAQSGRNDQRLKEIQALAAQHGIAVEWRERKVLDNLVNASHQGVIARTRPATEYDDKALTTLLEQSASPTLLLVLDGVTDPHNLGACLRSAEAAGVQAVIAPKDNSVGLTPVVRKVSCGAAEILPYIRVTNLARQLRQLQEQGIWLIGTSGEAEQTLYELDCKIPLALVMGAEGTGLRRLTRECCDYLAKIPMQGCVSSLNVSVAAGICLFEVVRQRS